MGDEIRKLLEEHFPKEQKVDSIEETKNETVDSVEEETANEIVHQIEEPKEDNIEKEENEGSVETSPSHEENSSTNLLNIDPNIREFIEKFDENKKLTKKEIETLLVDVNKKIRTNFDRKYTELGEDKKIANEIKKTFGKEKLSNEDIELIKVLRNFDTQLSQNPTETIKNLAKTFNVDLKKQEEIKETETFHDEEEDEYFISPQIKKKISSLEEKLNKFESFQKHQNELRAKQIEAESAKLINDFSNEKNEDGELKHPFFHEVENDMIKLAQADPELLKNLDELYIRAVRFNPITFTKSQEKERQKELSKKQNEIQKLKKASTSNPINNNDIFKKPKTYEEEIEELKQKYY